MSEHERAIREAMLAAFPEGNLNAAMQLRVIAAGLCALYRALREERGEVPNDLTAIRWRDRDDTLYEIIGKEFYGYPKRTHKAVGPFSTLAEACVAVARARSEQP